MRNSSGIVANRRLTMTRITCRGPLLTYPYKDNSNGVRLKRRPRQSPEGRARALGHPVDAVDTLMDQPLVTNPDELVAITQAAGAHRPAVGCGEERDSS